MDTAIALIDKRIQELVTEAQQLVAPYNVAIGELQKLRGALVPVVTVSPEEPLPAVTQTEIANDQ